MTDPDAESTVGAQRPAWVDPQSTEEYCYLCGTRWLPQHVEGIDLSDDDEYYPDMASVCPEGHTEGCR